MNKISQTVVHLSSVHSPFDTRIFVKECSSLVKAGYQTYLIVQHDQDEVKNGVNVIALPKSQKKGDRFLKVIPRLIKEVLKFKKGTILHFHDPELIPVCLGFKLLGYKIVYDIHEHTPADFLTKEWLPKWIRYPLSKAIELFEFLADKFFDGIVTVVPPVSKRFNNKNHVEISNYPLLSDYYYQKNKTVSHRNLSAIYIGDITYRRGIKEMVDAMEILNQSRETRLILGGRFSPAEIQSEIEALPGWAYCDFIGWQLMNDIWDRLHEAGVGLVTLQNVPSHLLLLPVKMFEYMAAGLPVVASDFPMFREIIDKHNCGLLVDPGSPREIAEAVKWIFDHPEKAAAMGERGKEAVKKTYNWKTEESELLDFYEGL